MKLDSERSLRQQSFVEVAFLTSCLHGDGRLPLDTSRLEITHMPADSCFLMFHTNFSWNSNSGTGRTVPNFENPRPTPSLLRPLPSSSIARDAIESRRTGVHWTCVSLEDVTRLSVVLQRSVWAWSSDGERSSIGETHQRLLRSRVFSIHCGDITLGWLAMP